YTHVAVVDDVLIYRHSAERFMMVVNASNIGKDFEWITSHNRADAGVENISNELTLLAMQGPKAQEILQPLTNIRLADIKYYQLDEGKVIKVDAILSSICYNGE